MYGSIRYFASNLDVVASKFHLRKRLLGINENSKSNGNVNYPKGKRFLLERNHEDDIFAEVVYI